ncbi:MAG: hypothetical protein ACOYBL_01985 [Lachnospiraceae bacterium]|jgi:DNA-directed RNA polymerase subunit RPC12/RpoP
MRNQLQRFMTGRYGVDNYGRFLTVLVLILCLFSIFIPNRLLYSITILAIIYCYYRILSKNHEQRFQENMKYLQIKDKLTSRFHKNPKNTSETQYNVYRCPNCQQKIRVPKGRGTIIVTCPKCHTEFKKYS